MHAPDRQLLSPTIFWTRTGKYRGLLEVNIFVFKTCGKLSNMHITFEESSSLI